MEHDVYFIAKHTFCGIKCMNMKNVYNSTRNQQHNISYFHAVLQERLCPLKLCENDITAF